MRRRDGCVPRHRTQQGAEQTAPEAYLECNIDTGMMATAVADGRKVGHASSEADVDLPDVSYPSGSKPVPACR